MVSIRDLALAASSIIGLAAAAPAAYYTPGKQNNTQEFYVTLHTTNSLHTNYNGYSLVTYHTGADLADPVFQKEGSRAFLNNTQLQFDVNAYPFSLNAPAGDTNYARWEPTSIGTSYGTQGFVNKGEDGIVIDSTEFGGWLVCQWYHGINEPQLFQLISGFDEPKGDYTSSCFTAKLIPKYI